MNSGVSTNKAAQRWFSFCSYSTHICISILSLLVKSSVRLQSSIKVAKDTSWPIPPADFPWKKRGFSMARNWGSGHAGNAIHQGHLVRSAPKIDPLVNLAWKPPHMSANSCFNMFQHVSGHVSSHPKRLAMWFNEHQWSHAPSLWLPHGSSMRGHGKVTGRYPSARNLWLKFRSKGWISIYVLHMDYIYNIMVIYIYILIITSFFSLSNYSCFMSAKLVQFLIYN